LLLYELLNREVSCKKKILSLGNENKVKRNQKICTKIKIKKRRRRRRRLKQRRGIENKKFEIKESRKRGEKKNYKTLACLQVSLFL